MKKLLILLSFISVNTYAQINAYQIKKDGTKIVGNASNELTVGTIDSSDYPGSHTLNYLNTVFGTGTVTSFSAGNLSPLFTTSVSNSTTTPSLTFSLSSVAAPNYVFASPNGLGGSPSFRALVSADIPTLDSNKINPASHGENYYNTKYFQISNNLSEGTAATIRSNISAQQQLNGTGFVKFSGTTPSYDNSTYTPTSRTLTINGTGYDLSADRSWTITTGCQPDAISFIDVTGANINTVTTSNAVILNGDTTCVWDFTVRGQGSPQIQINSESWAISNHGRDGDTIKVRLTSSGSNSTALGCRVYTNGFGSSFNVTTAAFLPTSVSGLVLWLRSDLGVTKDGSDFVSQWDDQSGNSNNSVSSGGNRPKWFSNVLNSHEAIRFDGTDDRLTIANSLTIADVFIVINNSDGATFGNNQTPFSNQSLSVANDRAFGACTVGTTDLAEDGFAGATGTYVNNSQTENFGTLSTFKLIEARKSSGTVTWPTSCLASDGLLANRYWGGDIVEVIVFNTSISASDRTNLVNYINSRYGLP